MSAYLRLLGLDEEVRAEALNLSDEDERVARLTEPRLRHLVGLQPWVSNSEMMTASPAFWVILSTAG